MSVGKVARIITPRQVQLDYQSYVVGITTVGNGNVSERTRSSRVQPATLTRSRKSRFQIVNRKSQIENLVGSSGPGSRTGASGSVCGESGGSSTGAFGVVGGCGGWGSSPLRLKETMLMPPVAPDRDAVSAPTPCAIREYFHASISPVPCCLTPSRLNRPRVRAQDAAGSHGLHVLVPARSLGQSAC